MVKVWQKIDSLKKIHITFVVVLVCLILALTYTLGEVKTAILESRKHEVYTVLSMVKYHSAKIINKEAQGDITKDEAEEELVRFLTGLRDGKARYVWANDNSAIARVHVRDKVVGTFQKSYIKDIAALVKTDPIYKTESNIKPGSEKRIVKINGVTKLPEWNWTVGYGIYLDDLDETYWFHANRIIFAYILVGFLCIVIFIVLGRKNANSQL